ncbi:MAG: 3-phosphoshikimate 1-carboxyvinyltransferase [Firmicutes bacterium]|nr:3-phosphoshikimate 1-carboxyvinyltransferase [Bacillota bacterium]
MDIKITPRKLSGNISAIPSKSHGHRLLIASVLNAMEDGDLTAETLEKALSRVTIPERSEDIIATENCLKALADDVPVLDCNESGSTIRFMLPVVMALKNEAVFTGTERLFQRPLTPLDEEMTAHGCEFTKESDTRLKVTGRLTPGTYVIPGNISSQYITGLLFALPLLDEDSFIEVPTRLESAGYIDLTLQVLRDFGVEVEKKHATKKRPTTFVIPGGQKYQYPESFAVEGDWSNTAVWFAANAMGSRIICHGIDSRSPQGDKAILDIIGFYSNLGSPYDKGGPVIIDVSDTPDLVPIAAVLATRVNRETQIVRAGRVRLKESDRLKTTTQLVSTLGGVIEETEDGLIIKGRVPLHGGEVDSCNDHRIVMAAALASTIASGPVIIKGAEAVNKSYPGFFRDFRKLGGITEEL